jgi:hypothetical protein
MSAIDTLQKDAERLLTDVSNGELDSVFKITYEMEVLLEEDRAAADVFLPDNFEICAKTLSSPRLYVKKDCLVKSGNKCHIGGVLIIILNGQPPHDSFFLPINESVCLIPGERQKVKNLAGENLGLNGPFNISGGVFYAQTTYSETHSNCHVDLVGDRAFLNFTKDIPAGGKVCILMNRNCTHRINNEKYVALVSLCRSLFIWEFQLPLVEKFKRFRKLQSDVIMRLLELAPSFDEMQLLLQALGENRGRIVSGVLKACMDVVDGTYLIQFDSQRGCNAAYSAKAVEFPINHLSFASVRNTFVFDHVVSSEKRHLFDVIRYVAYHRLLHSRDRFVIPARTNDQCWIELGDDCEYFLPLPDSGTSNNI